MTELYKLVRVVEAPTCMGGGGGSAVYILIADSCICVWPRALRRPSTKSAELKSRIVPPVGYLDILPLAVRSPLGRSAITFDGNLSLELASEHHQGVVYILDGYYTVSSLVLWVGTCR